MRTTEDRLLPEEEAEGTGTATLGNLTVPSGTLTVATNRGGNTTGGAMTQGAGTSLNVGTALLSTGNGAITLNGKPGSNNAT
ncbi:MAG TPA: hypothetical protein VJ805_00750 [Nitrospiraceae bacterium]|nr:hypothetical protein [Nitrospiraceae bacterium]